MSPLLTLTTARYLVTILTAPIAAVFPATAAATPAQGATVLSQATVSRVDNILREIAPRPRPSLQFRLQVRRRPIQLGVCAESLR
jgi:hypothetical protein